MPAPTDFMIGTTEGGMATLEALGLLNPKPDFSEFARLIETGDSGQRGMGLGSAHWYWGFLTEAHVAILETYCPNRTSSTVYIATAVRSTIFASYRAKLNWPIPVRWQAGKALEFTLFFRLLEAL